MKSENYHLKFRDLNPISFLTYGCRNSKFVNKDCKEELIFKGSNIREGFLEVYNVLLIGISGINLLEKLIN